MSVKEHRAALVEAMADNSIAILYSGRATLANEDEYLPFAVNSHFFYLTDYTRAGMILLLGKYNGRRVERMFIEQPDAFTERWTGKMPSEEEVRVKAQIADVSYISDFPGTVSSILGNYDITTAYFDCYRYDTEDLPTYNAAKAREFRDLYPAVGVKDIRSLIIPLREVKDAEELERMRSAVEITGKGLDAMIRRMRPGLMEYQAQAIFEAACRWEGAEGMAFPTIAAGGINACSMHYDTNRDALRDGDLAIFDLGAKYQGYCADVTRTYPVNGHFTPRQRQVYDLVLKANRAVIAMAAPGLTLRDLQTKTCEVLGEGLVELGLISDPKEYRKYYMHGVSHSLGLDSHDTARFDTPLKPGWVITDEPGLYIDEEGIGIRIEDDLLITETGCEVITAAIPRDPEEIERIMAE